MEKEFGKLDRVLQREIVSYLTALKTIENPAQRGKPLRGDKSGLWRYRVGKYRMICKLEKKRLVVFVIRIAKRDKV